MFEQMEFSRQNQSQVLQHQNFISCMAKINKNMDEDKAVSMLVLGTEQKQVIVLDHSGMSVKKQLLLKSVPCFLVCSGQYDVESRIFASCRDGKVYVIKNMEVTDQVFSIECKPIGLVLLEKQVLIAGMNNTIHAFYLKGKKNFVIQVPAAVVDMVKLEGKRTQ